MVRRKRAEPNFLQALVGRLLVLQEPHPPLWYKVLNSRNMSPVAWAMAKEALGELEQMTRATNRML